MSSKRLLEHIDSSWWQGHDFKCVLLCEESEASRLHDGLSQYMYTIYSNAEGCAASNILPSPITLIRNDQFQGCMHYNQY